MKPALDHAQTSRLAVLGSSTHCGGGPDEALGRVAQGEGGIVLSGNAVNPKGCAAVAMVRLVATGRTYRIPIARGVPAAERGRRVLGAAQSNGGRRSAAVAPWLRQIATIPAALLTSCGRSKPSDVDACFAEPFIESSHLHVLSAVRGLNDRDRDRERFANVRTAFQGSRNVFRG